MNWKIFGSKKNKYAEVWNLKTMFGPNLNFATTEAYKLLRTNIVFSFPDEGVGRAIGITSSVQSEGKSSTACNTAYALSEAGYKVLLLEADLRRPSISNKLGIARVPGVTNILIGKSDYRETVQQCEAAPNLDIITSGDIPPNPSELIGSSRMKRRLEQLASYYQFILLDLPPVTAVTDALVATKIVDGVVMVVRNEHADTGSLKEAMRQLKLVDAKMLGFVFTCAGGSSKGYRKKYKYRYYHYRDYGYGYGENVEGDK